MTSFVVINCAINYAESVFIPKSKLDNKYLFWCHYYIIFVSVISRVKALDYILMSCSIIKFTYECQHFQISICQQIILVLIHLCYRTHLMHVYIMMFCTYNVFTIISRECIK